MLIKTRLLWAIVGIMVFVGLFTGYIIYWQDSQKLTENSNAEIKSTINYTFQLVNFSFNRAQDSIFNLANNPVIIQAIETKDPQKLQRSSDIIQNAAETVNIVKNIALEEVSGSTCVVRSGDESVLSAVGKDLSARDYCVGIIKSKSPYISPAVINAATNLFVLPITVPVKNSAGEVIGLIVGSLDLGELRGYLLDLQQDSSVVLLDRSGVPFLDTTQEISKLDAPLTAVESEVKKGLADNKKEGYFQYQNNFVGYKSNDVITVIYEESNTKLLSFARALNFTIFLALTIALILMVAFIYFFVGIITKRISRLSVITQRIAGGEFNIRLAEKDFKAKDEVAVLARAFNNMAAKLKESYSGLEERVRIRTQDLENAKIATQNVLEDLQIEKETLDNAKAKDEALLASIGDGVVAVNSDRRIIIVNKMAEKLLGRKADEVMGKFCDDVIFMEDEKGNSVVFEERPLIKALSSSTTTTTTTTTNLYLVNKNKIKFPVAVTASPVILDKKIIGAVGVFRDITKEKEMDNAKTEFVSLASHQLRTPLTTINWYTEMILKGDVGKVIPSQKKYLEKIYAGNHRMIELINTLLNVSRIEMGTFMIAPELTNAVKLAQSAVDELRPQIDQKKITLTSVFGADIPLMQTDPKLLQMVVQNILSNAVEYTPEKGKIELSLVLDNEKKAVLLKVADTGYGIPRNQQDKVFTKLFRADNVREKDTDGTGLGLYIVKSIVENFGGKVWFESEENKGTIFYVSLPLSGMKKKEGTKSLI